VQPAEGEKRMPDVEQNAYANHLNSSRKNFPFSEWRADLGDELEQYSQANCDRAASIMNKLIDGLIDLGEAAPEATKVSLFKSAVEALNDLNDQTEMIETGEREELCDLFNQIATACGIDPGMYGRGEGLASEWRNW
jgi:hypothetical protein